MAGLYIHVPFCARRCVYCDFYSNTDRSLVAPYIEALIREMELREDYLNGEAIETIYLGGGTPSLLREADLDRLFKAIDRLYGLGDAKEITIEGNPDDLHPDYVAQLKHLPINRISMGIQSFHDDDLRLLNRRHSAQQAIEAVVNCVKAGLENISIDLIYGLPGQTPERWAKNLDTAISLQVPHLSAYHLTYEKGTPLDRMREAGQITPIDEDTSLILFGQLIDQLGKAGYEHYEISNFARPDRASRHNTKYWTLSEYAGFGPGAHSDFGEVRYAYDRDLEGYVRGVLEGTLQASEREELPMRERDREYIMLSLRTVSGINRRTFENRFRRRFAPLEAVLVQYENLGCAQRTEVGWRLTPRGFLLSNRIICDLWEALGRDIAQREAAAARGDFRIVP